MKLEYKRTFFQVLVIFNLLIFDTLVNAKEYYCPKVPFSAAIGETVDGWKIITKDNTYNFLYISYLKFKGEKYKFNEWIGIGGGVYNPRLNKARIYCCDSVGKNKNVALCVEKFISQTKCELYSQPKNEELKFICEDVAKKAN